MAEQIPNDDGPVTISVSRKVVAGQEQAYEEWVSGISKVSARYAGHMGVNVLRPSDATNGEYVIIYRFDNYQNACKWEKSAERAEWIDKLNDLVEGEATRKKVTGLEFWFDLPSIPVTMVPSKHKMALVLVFVVYTLVLTIGTLLQPVLGDQPFWVKLLLIIPIQVLLMTYLVMPTITRYLKNWIYQAQ